MGPSSTTRLAALTAGQNTFTYLRQLGVADVEAIELAVIVAQQVRATN